MRRPITVAVLLLAITLCAAAGIAEIPRDIFPNLNIPVIFIAQPYAGMSPNQMEGFLTHRYETRLLYVTGIERIESKSIQGLALLRLQFHPGTDMANAMAETSNQVQRVQRFMPRGAVPPFVLRFDAGSLPVGNLVFSSEVRTEDELADLARQRVRPLFATLEGVMAPPPVGGGDRSIMI
ncbi:MAG: efflux RND transporter permease subunit, partial [Planctomycetota bacterium]